MSQRQLIHTSQRGSYRPLFYQGTMVCQAHQQLMRLLADRFGSRHQHLFAEPVIDSAQGTIDWYTRVPGQPRALDQASPPTRALAEAELVRLVRDLEDFAQELEAAPDVHRQAAGRMLSLAMQHPDSTGLVLVGDQPVLAGWGLAPAASDLVPESLSRYRPQDKPEGTEAVVRDKPSLPPPPPPPAAPPDQPAPPSPPSPPAAPDGRGCAWWLARLGLLGLLLALLLVLLAWLLPPACTPLNLLPPGCATARPWVGISPTELELGPRLDEAQQRQIQLREELDGLRAELERRRLACVKPAAPAESEPPRPAEEKALDPPAKPSPTPPLPPPPRAAPAPPPAAKQPPATPHPPPPPPPAAKVAPQPELPECPPPPWVCVVFDTSASMLYPFEMTPDQRAIERHLNQLGQTGQMPDKREVLALVQAPGRKRLEASLHAVDAMLASMPTEIACELVLWEGCQRVWSQGPYPAGDRQIILNALLRQKPRGATALARALALAGQRYSLSGAEAGVVVVLTDGTDTCRGDPCLEALRLAQERPGLVVNVVDLAGLDELDCLVRPSGGRAYRPEKMADLAKDIAWAARAENKGVPCRRSGAATGRR